MTLNQVLSDAVANTAPMLVHRAMGAQVLQARLGGQASIFYLSPLSVGVGGPGPAGAPARGGVPVLFPQFADRGPLPKHGLVRTATWSLVKDHVTQSTRSVRYNLNIRYGDYPDWPHACKLRLTVDVMPDALVLGLRVTNTGNDTFNWTGGLHPYFAVQDVLRSSAAGLSGVGVQDRYDPAALSQPQGKLQWNGQPCERLYDTCPPLTLDTGRHSLRLSASGFDQWMVWNPGEAGASALTDLPADDWRRFVCLEPVCVDRPVVLAPGERFDGYLYILVQT